MITFTDSRVSKARLRRRFTRNQIEDEIRTLMLQAVKKVTASTSTAAITQALETGDVQEAMDRVRMDLGEDFLRSTLPAALRDAYESVGATAAASAAREIGTSYAFNLLTPGAVDWTARTAGSLITQWGESSRDTIRQIIARGFSAGEGAGAIARQIRQSGIGITWRNARSLLQMRQRLEAGGEVPQRIIDQQVAVKYQRLIRDRAAMIARTEMTRAMTHARLESWRQARDIGLLDGARYEKEWLTTNDARACDECLDLDGSRASVPDGVFMGDHGTFGGQGPGIHPRCRCTVILVEKGSERQARSQSRPGDPGIR